MSEINVLGPFNIDACDDCSKQSECAGFRFADSMRQKLKVDSLAISDRFEEALREATEYVNDSGRTSASSEMEIASKRFAGLLIKSRALQITMTEVVAETVIAQGEPESMKTADDFKRGTLEDILIEHREELGPNFTIEELDAIGTDVRYYASRGICGAISVEEQI
ncbi:hypothetical protein BH10PAT3_BH10PAT3_4210 [soil metagenome]